MQIARNGTSSLPRNGIVGTSPLQEASMRIPVLSRVYQEQKRNILSNSVIRRLMVSVLDSDIQGVEDTDIHALIEMLRDPYFIPGICIYNNIDLHEEYPAMMGYNIRTGRVVCLAYTKEDTTEVHEVQDVITRDNHGKE